MEPANQNEIWIDEAKDISDEALQDVAKFLATGLNSPSVKWFSFQEILIPTKRIKRMKRLHRLILAYKFLILAIVAVTLMCAGFVMMHYTLTQATKTQMQEVPCTIHRGKTTMDCKVMP